MRNAREVLRRKRKNVNFPEFPCSENPKLSSVQNNVSPGVRNNQQAVPVFQYGVNHGEYMAQGIFVFQNERSILVRFPINRRAAPSFLKAWRASSVSMTQNTSSWDSPSSSRYSPSSTWSERFPVHRKGSAGTSRPGGTCSSAIPRRRAEGHPE